MNNGKKVIVFRQRIKIALVESFDNKCFLCKNSFPQEVYDFHHIDPKEKEFGIASMGQSRSQARIANEAKKCIMLCSNCHRIIEHSEKDKHCFKSNFNEQRYYDTINELNGTAERLRKKEYEKAKKTLIKAESPLKPSREELKLLIRNYPFLQIGRKYGVSDNAIRKWCLKYNLPNKVSEILLISDEDWENI